MEAVTITFNDGTVIEADKNGSCYIVDAEPTFPDDLTGIEITGDETRTIEDGRIAESASTDGRYWFTILEISSIDNGQLRADIDYLLELSEAE